jgi:D-Tyr-tRNAtyr deacylase
MVDGECVGSIGPGLLVLLGVRRGDGEAEADRIVRKLLALRIFEDDEGRMNLSVTDTGGEVLCVSQFTLYGDARRGNRPSFIDSAPAGGGRAAVREGAFGARRAGRALRRAHACGARERRPRDTAGGGLAGYTRSPHGLSSAAGGPHLKVGFAAHLFFALNR